MTENEQVARYIFYKVTQACFYLHEEAKTIHRDIKLDNILFDTEECEVKLCDFDVISSSSLHCLFLCTCSQNALCYH